MNWAERIVSTVPVKGVVEKIEIHQNYLWIHLQSVELITEKGLTHPITDPVFAFHIENKGMPFFIRKTVTESEKLAKHIHPHAGTNASVLALRNCCFGSDTYKNTFPSTLKSTIYKVQNNLAIKRNSAVVKHFYTMISYLYMWLRFESTSTTPYAKVEDLKEGRIELDPLEVLIYFLLLMEKFSVHAEMAGSKLLFTRDVNFYTCLANAMSIINPNTTRHLGRINQDSEESTIVIEELQADYLPFKVKVVGTTKDNATLLNSLFIHADAIEKQANTILKTDIFRN